MQSAKRRNTVRQTILDESFDIAMASSGMNQIYERYKASPNYVSNELLDYLCDEKEFCNFCHFCGPEKTYFYTNASLKFHYRFRHAQEILKEFPNSKIENDDDSVTLSLSEVSKNDKHNTLPKVFGNGGLKSVHTQV